jgi:hypothetical protein
MSFVKKQSGLMASLQPDATPSFAHPELSMSTVDELAPKPVKNATFAEPLDSMGVEYVGLLCLKP